MSHLADRPSRRPRRVLGRRRRRLYWTMAILVGASLLGAGVGMVLYQTSRPQTYRTGEEHAGITRKLAQGIPENAPLPQFTDVTKEAGLSAFRTFAGTRTSQLPEDMGSGAAWGDFDHDGDDDLFLVSVGGSLSLPTQERAPSVLYKNRGDGTFVKVADFPDTRIIGMAAAWGDYNGDGWLDLVVTGYDSLLLYRNQQGRFIRDARLPDPQGFWAGAAWADFDHDGDLDLYVCGYVRYVEAAGKAARASQQYGMSVPYSLNPASYAPERNLLFRNRGDGTFEEVAKELGVANPEGRSLSALWHDFDDDGWLDLYVANDISDNVLYRNRAGTFEEISHAAWVADYRGAMGLAAGDWNRDGDDDLFITHWIAQENALYDSLLRDVAGVAPPPAAGAMAPTGSARQGLRFMDVAAARRLGQIALPRVGWGTEFADFDGDGWLDLVVANGSTFETEETPKRLRPQPAFLFWNQQGESFHDLAPLNPALAAPHASRGLALADYDTDGDVDILMVDHGEGVRLLRNDMQHGNWLEARLRSRAGKANPSGGAGEGARLIARLGDVTLRRTVSSASYLSQSSRTVHFGLGDARRIETLEIRWRRGKVDVYRNLAANMVWELREGDPTPRRVGTPSTSLPSRGAGAKLQRERLVEFWQKQRAAMRAMKVEYDLPRAIALFRQALALHPTHEDSLYYLGNSLAAQGDVEGALAQFAEMIRLNPQSHRAHKQWGTLRAMTATSGEALDAAVAALEAARSINPEETGTLLVLGELALMQGDVETSEQRLVWACRTNPRAAGGFFLLAYLAWKRGEMARARELLQRTHKALGEAWKPSGAVAEGDVRRPMHTDITPLARFMEAWDGSLDLGQTFTPLDAHLKTRKLH